MRSHKVLSYDQVCYNPILDRKGSLEEGLDYWSTNGWTLVAVYPDGDRTTFIFSRQDDD